MGAGAGGKGGGGGKKIHRVKEAEEEGRKERH